MSTDLPRIKIDDTVERRRVVMAQWMSVAPQARVRAKQILRNATNDNPSRIVALRRVYDLIPPSNCAPGQCADSCTVIEMTDLEYALLYQACGVEPKAFGLAGVTDVSCHSCPLLSDDGLCTQYELRPAVCRLFGVTPELGCEHCTPEGMLTSVEGLAIFMAVVMIGDR